jgi:hypothetical protein
LVLLPAMATLTLLPKELVRLHGGTLTVQSATESESMDGSHGSTFTVTVPLGKDHLPRGHVDENAMEGGRSRLYAKGIVDEATQWLDRPLPTADIVSTPSASSDSSGSDGNKSLDPSTLFFLKSDIILLGRRV